MVRTLSGRPQNGSDSSGCPQNGSDSFRASAQWFGQYPGIRRMVRTVSGRPHDGFDSIRASAEWFGQYPASVEWQALLDKKAVLAVGAKEAAWIRKNQAHRIMGSRFVIVKKPEEDLIENGQAVDPNNLAHGKVKARWCLQGHLDPDLSAKASAGQLQSPTLSQMGRTVLFQLMATFRATSAG